MAKITSAGLTLLASLQAAGQALTIDKFIYADIVGLDTTVEPPAGTVLPAAADIKHESAITKAGYVGPDTVVYSNMLSSAVGDFYFNWIGLFDTAHNTLVAVSFVPRQQKKATAAFQMGNTLTKNFAVQYLNLTDLAGVTINASTWQIDLWARLAGIDERERMSNYDIYGTKFFFYDGFLLVKNGTAYELTAGFAYIDGIRIKLDAVQDIGATGALPKMIYLDTCLNGDYSGVEAAWTVQISAAALNHYQDIAKQQHYLEQIATINADGSVTDHRGDGIGGTIRNSGDLMAAHLAAKDPHPQYNRPMFEIFYSMSTETPPGAYPLWTGESIANCDQLFPQFWAKALAAQAAGYIRTVAAAVYEAELTTYGETGAFVIDATAKSIRLPKVIRHLRSIEALADLGTPMLDEVKKHKHTYRDFGGTNIASSFDVAAAVGNYSEFETSETGGNENTVRSVKVPLYIQVYTAAIPASVAQAAEFVLALTSKADKTLGNVLEADARAAARNRIWTSAEQAISYGILQTVTHGITGLDVSKAVADFYLVCKTAEYGYSVGDVLQGCFAYCGSGIVTTPIPVILSTTTASVITRGYGILLTQKDAAGTQYVTAANWRIVFRIRY